MPTRIQRKRTKGFRLPPNTVCCTRPGKFSNPFKIGGWYKIGGDSGIRGIQWSWVQCYLPNEPGYTLIETPEQSVAMFRKWALQRTRDNPKWLDELRAADFLACFCPLDAACHVDTLLEILR